MILFPVKNRNFEMSHFFCRQPPLAEYPASASLESSSPITNPPPNLGFKEACLILSCLGNRVIDVFQFFTKCFVF